MSKNYLDTLNEQLKIPNFKKEYDALESDFHLINALLSARQTAKITQKQLSEITGIAQSDISRIENGNANPSMNTLKRLAAGMGMTVKVEFVPRESDI